MRRREGVDREKEIERGSVREGRKRKQMKATEKMIKRDEKQKEEEEKRREEEEVARGKNGKEEAERRG